MGNTVSNNNSSIRDVSNKIVDASEVDTLNWNDYNTDDISVASNDFISNHNIPSELSYLNNLNIPTISESESDNNFMNDKNTNNIINIPFAKTLANDLTDVSDNMSNTSPFISSEMYRFVMKGGAENDESESSSTSSSSSDKKDKKEEVSKDDGDDSDAGDSDNNNESTDNNEDSDA